MSSGECLPLSAEARGGLAARGGPAARAAPWAGWEAEVETGAASPPEDRGDPGGTPPAGASSTEPATGSAPTRDVETRTLPGEQSAISARLLNRKGFCHPRFPLQEETVAEVAPGGCEAEEEGASWTAGDPVACSEVAAAETEADSEEAGAWTEVATEEGDGEEEDLEARLDRLWTRWEAEAEAEGVEDQERWTRVSTARSAETGPTRGRPRRAAFTTRFIF